MDDADHDLIGVKRWDHMRLGFAVQLGTVRFLDAFLKEPRDVPAGVTADLARQLDIGDAACLALRHRPRKMAARHEIREQHGYREFADFLARFRLTR